MNPKPGDRPDDFGGLPSGGRVASGRIGLMPDPSRRGRVFLRIPIRLRSPAEGRSPHEGGYGASIHFFSASVSPGIGVDRNAGIR